jgi:hypothetical protein
MYRFKRKKCYVDRKVQGALLRQTVLHWFLVLASTLFLVFILQMLTGGPFRSWSYHVGQVWSRYAPLIIALVAVIPPVIYDSLRLSHRFVGPIYRLRTAMHALAAGGPAEPVHFRKDDFWKDLADDYNLVLKRIPSDSREEDSADDSDQAETEITPELIPG